MLTFRNYPMHHGVVCPLKKKNIHVSCALVHVCMKFLIEYTDGVDN